MAFQIPTNQKEAIDYFRKQLSFDQNWVERGIVVLFQFQTEDEKSMGETSELNNVGFTGADAAILSSFAKQLNKGWHLSDKQLAIAFKKMPKYAAQLFRISKKGGKSGQQ